VTPAVTVALNDRVLVIGNTQPTVTGGSASYQPHTTIYPRDDSAATPTAKSVVTTSTDGLYAIYAADGLYDLLFQDNNRANVGIIPDAQIGSQPLADFTPITSAAVSLGTCALPFNNLYLAGKWVSGITSAAGRTYFDFLTCHGVTQGNLFAFGVSNQAPKVYGDTHGGVFQSWTLPEVFNVKSSKYGAKGDNSTDDTTAISNALTDAAATVSGTAGGVVFLPRGTYIVNSTLTIPTKVRLVGAGRSATVIKAGGSFTFNGTTDAVVRIGNAGVNAHGTRIENLLIDCNDIANSICVYSATANEQSGIRECTLQRYRLYGAYFATTSSANFSVRDSEFFGSDTSVAGMIGVWLSACAGAAVIDRCTFNSYSGAAELGMGIHLDHTGGHVMTVSNCHFENSDFGIRQTGNSARLISNTGNASCTVLFNRANPAVNTVIDGLYSGGSPVAYGDSTSGYTASGVVFYAESNGLESVMWLTSAIGNTWTLPNPLALSGRIKSSGTFVWKDFSLLGCSTTLLLPAGNGFALSTPAGNTAVTSITPLDNGRRVTFIGSSGSVTFTNGTGLKTAGPVVAPGEAVTFECWGTTWHQITAKL
jgi:hypothetical protein